MKLYTVYDKEADIYMPPMNQPNDVTAMRAFAQEVNRKQEGNMLNFAPEHFALYYLGEFSEKTGVITPELKKLAEATAVIRA